jgi:2,4-diaminopentanoate dehydrogenase
VLRLSDGAATTIWNGSWSVRTLRTRVGVWGVGMTGSAVVQLVARNPDLELVAGLGYNPEKQGRDVGELAGAGQLAVGLTLDPQEFIDAGPQVAVYLARDLGTFAADDDLIRLLEAGINTITALPYANLAFRGEQVRQRFEDAARRGGATFVVSGIDPDYVWERQVLTASGLCGELDAIHITEIFRGDTLGEQTMPLFGFGLPVEQVHADTAFQTFVRNYIAPSMQWGCAQMGVELDEVTVRSISEPTDRRIEHPLITIEPGTVGLSITRIEGWLGGRVFATQDIKYHVGVNRPAEAPVDECWIVELEGRPSVRVVVQSLASVRDGTERYADDPKSIPPGYWITAGPLVRAIPVALAAEPGIKEPALPEMRYVAPLTVNHDRAAKR